MGTSAVRPTIEASDRSGGRTTTSRGRTGVGAIARAVAVASGILAVASVAARIAVVGRTQHEGHHFLHLGEKGSLTGGKRGSR